MEFKKRDGKLIKKNIIKKKKRKIRKLTND